MKRSPKIRIKNSEDTTVQRIITFYIILILWLILFEPYGPIGPWTFRGFYLMNFFQSVCFTLIYQSLKKNLSTLSKSLTQGVSVKLSLDAYFHIITTKQLTISLIIVTYDLQEMLQEANGWGKLFLLSQSLEHDFIQYSAFRSNLDQFFVMYPWEDVMVIKALAEYHKINTNPTTITSIWRAVLGRRRGFMFTAVTEEILMASFQHWTAHCLVYTVHNKEKNYKGDYKRTWRDH